MCKCTFMYNKIRFKSVYVFARYHIYFRPVHNKYMNKNTTAVISAAAKHIRWLQPRNINSMILPLRYIIGSPLVNYPCKKYLAIYWFTSINRLFISYNKYCIFQKHIYWSYLTDNNRQKKFTFCFSTSCLKILRKTVPLVSARRRICW